MTRDRINEVYWGRLFSKAAQENTRLRIHWIVERVKGKSVLDIGCSQGIVSILLARAGKSVVGIDKELTAVATAESEARAESAAVRRRLRFVCLDAFSDALRAGLKFDTVVLGQVLEHVKEADTLIGIAHEACRPNGRLILTTPFGIIDHPDHAHVFYPHSLLKLTRPRFQTEELAIIGKRICLTLVKEHVEHPFSCQLLEHVCELSENAFAEIEEENLKMMTSHREKIAAQNDVYQRLKGQLRRREEQVHELREEMKKKNEAFRAQCEKFDLTKKQLQEMNQENDRLREQLNFPERESVPKSQKN